jgi:hypothetical protein
MWTFTIGKIAGPTITNPIIFIGFDLGCGDRTIRDLLEN